jgi:D-3-phosphoglycerate dehydrogenase
MRAFSDTVNMVNAPSMARDRNIEVAEVRHERDTDYQTLVRVAVRTATSERSVAGTLFGASTPRLVEIFGIKVEADFASRMLFIVNEDKPGFIGRLGTRLGEAGVNIGTFHLGRRNSGGEAILLLSVDQAIDEPLLWDICRLPGVRTVKSLRFA